MTAHLLSSGDLLADRRAEYARMLAEGGEFAAAAELMEQALEIAPQWAAGWFLKGEFHEKAGEQEKAVAAFRKTLELSENDIFGAVLKLSILGAREQPDQPPSAYVEQLFDDYADAFEEALVEKLDYKVPQYLRSLISRQGWPKYDRAIDLGCGTGLLGVEIKPFCSVLEGYDLSTNMLAKAGEKGLYDILAQADLSRGLDEERLFENGLAPSRADLVAAADVLMYLGDLSSVFALARELLAPGGHFAFSVELSGQESGFHLQPSMRFAHSQAYIESLLLQSDFRLVTFEKLVIRMDAGAPVNGILFLSQLGGNV